MIADGDTKPFSQACVNNRQPILAVLQRVFMDAERLLEIGSGTGQHAVYFSQELPHLTWQPSDVAANIPGIQRWLDEFPRPNLQSPLELDVLADWPLVQVDAVFSANTAHIMSWPAVQAMVAGVGALLPPQGLFALYGPFNYEGRYTSDSNARFDVWLKAQGAEQGIRDFEKVHALAYQAGMALQEDNAMPANNRLLVWRRRCDD